MKKLLAFIVLVTMCLSNFFVLNVEASGEANTEEEKQYVFNDTLLIPRGDKENYYITSFETLNFGSEKNVIFYFEGYGDHAQSNVSGTFDVYEGSNQESDKIKSQYMDLSGDYVTSWVSHSVSVLIKPNTKYWFYFNGGNPFTSGGIRNMYVEELIINSIPEIGSANTEESYINKTNSGSFNVQIEGINDDTDGNLDFLYSTDGTNYSNIDVELYKELNVGENINSGSIVGNQYREYIDTIVIDKSVKQDSQSSNSAHRTISIDMTANKDFKFNSISFYVDLSEGYNGTGYVEIFSYDENKTYTSSKVTMSENQYGTSGSRKVTYGFNDLYFKAGTNYYIEDGFDGDFYGSEEFEYVRRDGGASVTEEYLSYRSTNSIQKFEIPITETVYEDKIELKNGLYLSNSNDKNSLEYKGIVKQDYSSGSTAKVYIDKVDLSDTLTSDLIPGQDYYLSDNPGGFSTTPGTNSVLFGTAIDEKIMQINHSSIENAKADISLDLSDLPEGNNTLYFKTNDGEADSVVSTLLLLKDTVAPELSETNSIGLTNDSTPEFTFNATESGNIQFNGSCASATNTANAGNNTIELQTLSEGIYNDCTITVTDNVGNVSDVLNISEFEVDTTAPVEPTRVTYNGGIGYSTTMNFPLEITHSDENDVNLWCAVASGSTVNDCNFVSEKPTDFSFTGDGRQQINFYLQDLAGNTTQYLPEESILIDTVDPVISIDKDFDSSYTNTGKILEASVVDVNLNRFGYAYVDATTTCDNTVYYENEYTGPITADNELLNGQKICFNAFDDAGRNAFGQSSVIENIDMSNPEEPVINAGQSKWNTFKIKGTCTYEEGLQLVVLDNGVEIAREDLSDPCVLDFEYTLSDSVTTHNIEYYLEDKATNKSLRQNSTAYVDATGVLITPQGGKTVEPIVTFFGYGQPNQEVKIKNTVSDEYIASGFTDANGVFSIQTTTSQALGNLTIDLELGGLLKNEPRTVIIEASSIIVPTIDENSVFSKYSGVKDIYSFEEQNISFTAMGEPLSKFKVYSYADVGGDRVITQIAHGQFDSEGKASVSSDVALPGGENEIVIIDIIHDVSSNIVYAVIADPFGVVYDSVTKQPIIGAKVSFCREGETTPALLPQLHGEDQPNPVITNSSGNYFSYHEVGNRYYVCGVQADGYEFPSKKITSGSDNLDGTPNIGSHGQVFEVIPTPLHIDIPLDKKVEIQKSSGGGGGGGGGLSESILLARETDRNYSTVGDRQLMVLAQKGTKTEQKTRSTRFGGGVYAGDLYRVLYESGVCKNTKTKCGIDFTQPVLVQITDKKLPKNFSIKIRYDERADWVDFTNFELLENTISFETERGFELKVLKKEIGNDLDISQNSEKVVYKVVYYDIKNPLEYVRYYKILNQKLGKTLDKKSDNFINVKLPSILGKLQKYISKGNNKEIYKYIYNYLGKYYEDRIL